MVERIGLSQNWNLIDEGKGCKLNDVSFYDDMHGLAVGTRGFIFVKGIPAFPPSAGGRGDVK
jgi:hypothetical protein